MPSFRYRDEDDSSNRGMIFLVAGALAGLAAGVMIAQRYGGVSGIASRVRDRMDQRRRRGQYRWRDAAEYEPDEFETEVEAAPDEELEERVLEAFLNDPIMAERAVDIGAVGDGIVELTGWVHDEEETRHATTVAGGVPGVVTVVNRLAIRDEEAEMARSRSRVAAGDDALTEARWEGQRVGTGRRRQGTSNDPDRHADPKVNLEDRWMNEQESLRAAAEEVEGIAERRKAHKKNAAPKGDRTGGAPIAPTGVPKADHVADPIAAQDVLRESTGRSGEPRAD